MNTLLVSPSRSAQSVQFARSNVMPLAGGARHTRVSQRTSSAGAAAELRATSVRGKSTQMDKTTISARGAEGRGPPGALPLPPSGEDDPLNTSPFYGPGALSVPEEASAGADEGAALARQRDAATAAAPAPVPEASADAGSIESVTARKPVASSPQLQLQQAAAEPKQVEAQLVDLFA